MSDLNTSLDKDMKFVYLVYMSKIVCMHGTKFCIKKFLSVFDTVLNDNLL